MTIKKAIEVLEKSDVMVLTGKASEYVEAVRTLIAMGKRELKWRKEEREEEYD